jgi:hypothetical protein
MKLSSATFYGIKAGGKSFICVFIILKSSLAARLCISFSSVLRILAGPCGHQNQMPFFAVILYILRVLLMQSKETIVGQSNHMARCKASVSASSWIYCHLQTMELAFS